MRLSLIDHEEQQRREAEERRKQEAAAAADNSSESNTNHGASSGTQATSAPGSEFPPPTQPPEPSTQPSLQTSSVATSTSSNTQPSDTTRNQPSLRNQASNNGESFGSWNSRAPNPAPFATSNIAFTPASTAVASLGPPLTDQRQEVRATESTNTATQSTPNITPSPAVATGYNILTSSAEDPEHGRPPLVPKPIITSPPSMTSPDVSGNELGNPLSRYGQLLSSPESEAFEPLLPRSSDRKVGLGAESTYDDNNTSRSHSRTVTPSPDDGRGSL